MSAPRPADGVSVGSPRALPPLRLLTFSRSLARLLSHFPRWGPALSLDPLLSDSLSRSLSVVVLPAEHCRSRRDARARALSRLPRFIPGSPVAPYGCARVARVASSRISRLVRLSARKHERTVVQRALVPSPGLSVQKTHSLRNTHESFSFIHRLRDTVALDRHAVSPPHGFHSVKQFGDVGRDESLANCFN